MISDPDLYSPSLAKKLKRKIEHRMAIIEDAAYAMVAIADQPSSIVDRQLEYLREIEHNLSVIIDERTRKPKT